MSVHGEKETFDRARGREIQGRSSSAAWRWLAVRRGGAWVGFLLALLLPLSAGARFQIPRVEDAQGLKIGERTTFHGGLSLPIGLDSNVFNETRAEGRRVASFIFPSAWLGIGNRDVRDGLLMSPPERSGRIVDYNLSAIAGFRQYLAQDVVVRSQPRFSAGASLRLSLLPGRRFSIVLNEDFFRGANSGNYELNGRLFNFNRIDHNGEVLLIGRPGGGRVALTFGYRSGLLVFTDPNLFRSNRLVNGVVHETKWRILPKSAIYARYTLDHTYYFCCVDTDLGRNEDNFAHRITGGFRGQILKKMVLDVGLGWGLAFYRADPDRNNFSSFIGDATLDYYPTLRSRLRMELFRRFADSLWGNYFVDTGAAASFQHTFRWKMLAHAGVSLAGRTYHALPIPGVEDRTIVNYEGTLAEQLRQRSLLVTLDVGAEQPLGKLFSIALRYTVRVDATDFRVLYENGLVNDLGYVKQLLWLMAAVRI